MPKKKDEALVEVQPASLAEVGAGVLGFLRKQADEFYEPGFLTFKIVKEIGQFVVQGQEQTFPEIIGIILSVELTRSLWSYGTSEEEAIMDGWTNGRPICSSRNNFGVRGELIDVVDNDTPEIVKTLIKPIVGCDYCCKPCAYNQFGSSLRGAGKLCKESRRFLIWNPENKKVGVLSVPPSSIRNWINYRAALPEKQFSSVVTKVTLSPMEKGNNKWSVANFHAGEEVTFDMIAPLGKPVTYNGQAMMETEALVAEFLNLNMTKDADYDTTPNGVVVEGSDF